MQGKQALVRPHVPVCGLSARRSTDYQWCAAFPLPLPSAFIQELPRSLRSRHDPNHSPGGTSWEGFFEVWEQKPQNKGFLQAQRVAKNGPYGRPFLRGASEVRIELLLCSAIGSDPCQRSVSRCWPTGNTVVTHRSRCVQHLSKGPDAPLARVRLQSSRRRAGDAKSASRAHMARLWTAPAHLHLRFSRALVAIHMCATFRAPGRPSPLSMVRKLMHSVGKPPKPLSLLCMP